MTLKSHKCLIIRYLSRFAYARGVPQRELANQGADARRKTFVRGKLQRIALVGHLILSWPAGRLGSGPANSRLRTTRSVNHGQIGGGWCVFAHFLGFTPWPSASEQGCDSKSA